MMAPRARQIGNVAVRAFLHRIGVAVSVDVTILLMDATNPIALGNACVHHLTAERAAGKRGLVQMQADAALLQRRVAQYHAEAARWQARAEFALQVGDASLARQALARKLELLRVTAQYAEAQTTQQRALDQMQAAVAHVGAQLRAVQISRASGLSSRPVQVRTRVVRDHKTVEARWEQFELDQAMDALRRMVQS